MKRKQREHLAKVYGQHFASGDSIPVFEDDALNREINRRAYAIRRNYTKRRYSRKDNLDDDE